MRCVVVPAAAFDRNFWLLYYTQPAYTVELVMFCRVEIIQTQGRRNMRQAKFSIGQCVYHRLFDYRGVIVDVDAEFQGTEAWYDAVARSRPPKDEPWYRVLVHDSDHETYVAERNLTEDTSCSPVNHPLLGEFFVDFDKGIYMTGRHDS